jgi:hypothetical protein
MLTPDRLVNDLFLISKIINDLEEKGRLLL